MPANATASQPESLWWHHAGWRYGRLAFWVLIAIAFTCGIIHHSQQRGRLSAPPSYDDVVYLADGMQRLQRFEANGLAGVAEDFVAVTPHAPLSSLLAGVGFGTLGRVDHAPYAMNIFVLLILLLGADLLLSGVLPVARILIGLFVLAVPLAGYAIHEFRPDIACGVLTGFGAAHLLGSSLAGRSRRSLVAGGLVFGAALWAKPSVFPVTGLLMGAACLAVIVRERLDREHPRTLAQGIRASLWIIGPALLVAAPYFIVHGVETWQYIVNGIWGEARILGEAKLPLSETLSYYLDGWAGKLMMRRHLPMALLLLGISVFWLLAHRRWRALGHIASYLAVVLLAYAVVTLNHVKTQFLGVSFFTLVIFGAVLLLAGLARRVADGRVPALAGKVLLGCICVVAIVQFRKPREVENSEMRAGHNQALPAVYTALVSYRRPGNQALAILTSGGLNGELIDYWLRRDGLPAFRSLPVPLVTDLEAYDTLIAEAEMVVASEPGNAEVYAHLPSHDVQAATLARMQANPLFEEVARIPTRSGKDYVLFRRRASNTPPR